MSDKIRHIGTRPIPDSGDRTTSPSPLRRRVLRAGVGALPAVYTLQSGAATSFMSQFSCLKHTDAGDLPWIIPGSEHDHLLRQRVVWGYTGQGSNEQEVYCVSAQVQHNDPHYVDTTDYYYECVAAAETGQPAPDGESGMPAGQTGYLNEPTTTNGAQSNTNANADWVGADGSTWVRYDIETGLWIKVAPGDVRIVYSAEEYVGASGADQRFATVFVNERGEIQALVPGDGTTPVTGSCWLSLPSPTKYDA